MIRRTPYAALAVATLLCPVALLAQAEPDPDCVTIMRRTRDNVRVAGSEMVSTLLIHNAKGQTRERSIAAISKLYDDGKTEKRLIRFVAPADVKGTGLLTYDYEDRTDDLWLFMPALRKTRRIVASEKAKSFMGSEFSYADITPPRVEDFKYKMLRSEKVDGVDCWVIEGTPVNDDVAEENGYSRRIASVGKADYVIRHALQYDLDGELAKELTVRDVKEVDTTNHRFRAMYMKMTNKQNGRSSELKISKFQLRGDAPDDYFTQRYLERQ